MAISLLQQAVGTVAALATSSNPATLNSQNTIAGSALYIISSVQTASVTVLSCSGGNGGTWTKAIRTQGTVGATEIWYSQNQTGGQQPALTANYSAKCGNIILAGEFGGTLQTGSLLDGTATGKANTNTSPNTGNLTTTVNGSVFLAALTITTIDAITAGPTNSFNALTAYTGSAPYVYGAYLVLNTAGVDSTAWTLTASQPWQTCLCAFQPGAADTEEEMMTHRIMTSTPCSRPDVQGIIRGTWEDVRRYRAAPIWKKLALV